MIRYENMNPQHIALVEKIEEQDRIIGELKNDYQFACKYNEIIVNALNSLTEEIRAFEQMPWYKRMFYKFK